MDRIKARIFEILTDPPDDDRLGNFISGAILILIAVNVVVCILETVEALGQAWGPFFYYFELGSVAVFSVEYLLRLWACPSSPKSEGALAGRWRLVRRPLYLIDLLAILPLYLQAFVPGLDLRFVRALRLFRLFRLFRFGKLQESIQMFATVIRRRRDELIISFTVVFISVIIISYLMFMIENEAQPEAFSSVPAAMWWGIITMTTIGYGDLSPVTTTGQVLGGIVGFLGLCVLALPISIIGAGFIHELQARARDERLAEWERLKDQLPAQSQELRCPHCGEELHVQIVHS